MTFVLAMLPVKTQTQSMTADPFHYRQETLCCRLLPKVEGNDEAHELSNADQALPMQHNSAFLVFLVNASD